MYRPPSGSVSDFFQHFEKPIEAGIELKLHTAFIGDFNINACPQNQTYLTFEELFESYGCHNAINVPTRITSKSQTTLDLCITSFPRDNILSGTLVCSISDHLPIYCLLPSKKPSTSRQKGFGRSITEHSAKAFVDCVSGLN